MPSAPTVRHRSFFCACLPPSLPVQPICMGRRGEWLSGEDQGFVESPRVPGQREPNFTRPRLHPQLQSHNWSQGGSQPLASAQQNWRDTVVKSNPNPSNYPVPVNFSRVCSALACCIWTLWYAPFTFSPDCWWSKAHNHKAARPGF